MNELDILIYLGKKGAFATSIPLTTSKIGNDLGESQQNVSRWLIKMEKGGLIFRKSGIKGYLIQITPEGERHLRNIKSEIEYALNRKGKVTLKGIVVTGIGDGKYYMSIAGYAREVKRKLGFRPYPGTLNIKLTDMTSIRQKEKIRAARGITIPGFVQGRRVLGSLKCFPATIDGVKCAVVIPDRSHHPFNIMEIISPFCLRRKLSISDGDEVKAEVEINEGI
ncbi:MAG: CTP-dependent riboflavin kinase [Candidatus Micrarchaeota archaeon]|nr:CTP-dependent riboflavin kinase [Candidatus Micrarchaeota archaeon]